VGIGGCGRHCGRAGYRFELRIRALSLRRLIGAVIGSVLGIFGAFSVFRGIAQ